MEKFTCKLVGTIFKWIRRIIFGFICCCLGMSFGLAADKLHAEDGFEPEDVEIKGPISLLSYVALCGAQYFRKIVNDIDE